MSVLVTIRVTITEAYQLLSYLNDRDGGSDAGWYYGKKSDFEKRHASLREVLERAIARHSDGANACNEVKP